MPRRAAHRPIARPTVQQASPLTTPAASAAGVGRATGDPRFELGLTESESVVLPLHQSPKTGGW
jgi:hypothetical protein